jgi:hypothetical protein
MKNYNLIHSVLSASSPFTLYIFFTLESKEMGTFSLKEGYYKAAAEDLENLLMDNFQIDLAQ